jgi:hypothetical protein
MATTDAASGTTTLFGNAGRRARFWLSQNVPDRGHIKKMIVVSLAPRERPFHKCARLTKPQENGGEVVLLETHADVMLVDHMKKNLPPGWYGSLCIFITCTELTTTAAFHTNMWNFRLGMDVLKISKNTELALLRHGQWAHHIFPKKAPERISV